MKRALGILAVQITVAGIACTLRAQSTSVAPSDDTRRRELLEERLQLTRLLKSVDGWTHAQTFMARVHVVCYSQTKAFPLLSQLGTVEDLEISYAQLMNQKSRPDPLLVQAWGERLSHAHANMDLCQSKYLNGYDRLPTDDEEKDLAGSARSLIADVDRELADPNYRSASPTPSAKPPDPAPLNARPIPIRQLQPEYSEEARRANFNGEVLVDAVVDDHGNVESATVVNSPGLGLDEKVLAAARLWRFEPGVKDGVPASFNLTIKFTFKASGNTPITSQPAAAPQSLTSSASSPAIGIPETAESRDLHTQYDDLMIRADVARAGLDAFEREQSRQGLRLRADIREAKTRMDIQMRTARSSLQGRDFEAARLNLRDAESAIAMIEKFLGK